jgi:undecaprenyl-diphosphatase
MIEESNLLKGGLALALYWWAWFQFEKTPSNKRNILLFTFVSSTFALLLARTIALLIPFRDRPFQNPDYHFQLPFTVTGFVHSWNSAPSDHAVLFFCLATSLWMVSWRLGVVAMCHALFVVSFPRIYVGYHYPTDIISGALVGIGMGLTCNFARLRDGIALPALRWMEKHPAPFYALAFAWTFEVA